MRLVARDAKHLRELMAGTNERHLAGVAFPNGLSSHLDVGSAEIVAYAVPAQAFAEALERHPLPAGAIGVICAKGIDAERDALLPTVAAQTGPRGTFAVLSGPGFAREIGEGCPTAMTLAAHGLERARALAKRLSTSRFRLYASDDPLGAAAGGALKNVAAIACGMARGLELGASAEAALATRAARELTRLVVALGGRAETFGGLLGLGDLMLTCTSSQSRNFGLGVALGRGDGSDGSLAEGSFSAAVAARLARYHRVDAPIVSTVADILAGRSTPPEALDSLMQRPLRDEVS